MTTPLEELIREQTRSTVEITVARSTALIAEMMAGEILKDPAFRAEVQAIIKQAFTDHLRTLRTPRKKRR